MSLTQSVKSVGHFNANGPSGAYVVPGINLHKKRYGGSSILTYFEIDARRSSDSDITQLFLTINPSITWLKVGNSCPSVDHLYGLYCSFYTCFNFSPRWIHFCDVADPDQVLKQRSNIEKCGKISIRGYSQVQSTLSTFDIKELRWVGGKVDRNTLLPKSLESLDVDHCEPDYLRGMNIDRLYLSMIDVERVDEYYQAGVKFLKVSMIDDVDLMRANELSPGLVVSKY